MTIAGYVLIASGLIYLVKPDIFQRGIWKNTAISQRLLTPEQNKAYMRVLGCVLIAAGLALAAALPVLPYACGLAARMPAGDVVRDALVPLDGQMRVRRVEPDPALLRRYEVTS